MPFEPGNQEAKKSDHSRPRRLTQRLIAALDGQPEEAILPGATCEHRVIHALLSKAMDGDVMAAREVFDRVEGKVTQPIGGDAENPVRTISKIEYVVVDPRREDADSGGEGIPAPGGSEPV